VTNGQVAVPISKTRFTCVRFEALTAMLLRVLVFRSVTLFQSVNGYWHLWCLHLFILESEGTTSLQNVGNYSPYDTVMWHKKGIHVKQSRKIY